jgi:hypothetical protein
VAAGKHPYYVEAYPETERPRRFLEAFAAILEHTNYDFVLDNFARTVTRCGRCATSCQVYQASGEARDIPCERSDLLLSVYKRYFTTDGRLTGRFGGGFELTDEHIDRDGRRVLPLHGLPALQGRLPDGVDHGLVTHLGRWVLAEIGIVPKALVVSTREQLEGKTGNTSAIPVGALKDTASSSRRSSRRSTVARSRSRSTSRAPSTCSSRPSATTCSSPTRSWATPR